MILAPNIMNMVGVFTMGFGIMTSVVTNNVSALAALANGLLPLRKVARAEADRLREREANSGGSASRDLVPLTRPLTVRREEPAVDPRRVLAESA